MPLIPALVRFLTVRRAAIVLVASLSVIWACGPITNFHPHRVVAADTTRPQSPRDAVLVVGLQLPRDDSELTGAIVMAYVNGNRLVPKGIVAPGRYKVGAQVGTYMRGTSILDDTTYVVGDASGSAHRTWTIPADMFQAGQPVNVFVFVQQIRSPGGVVGPFRFRQWPGRSHPWPVEYRSLGGGTFKGACFQISQPGAFYIGDVAMRGAIREANHIEGKTVFSRYEVRTSSNPAAAQTYLGEVVGLVQAQLIDASASWRDFALDRFEDLLAGGLPE